MLAILKRKLRLISLNHSLTKTMAIITAPGAMTERKYSRWNGSVDKSTRQTVRLSTGRSDGDVSDRRVARESEVTACGWRTLYPTREPEGKAAGEWAPNRRPTNILSEPMGQGICC